MGFCGGGDGGAGAARAEEAARQQRIKTGTAAIDSTFSSFTPEFFEQRAQDYTNAAMPTLTQEHNRTKNSLGYALAERGLLNSSTRDQRENSLEAELNKQKRIIGDTGLGQANDLRQKVESSRNEIYSQLLASADPAQASAAALRQSSALSSPSPVGSIGNFFNDWSNIYLTNQAARASDPNVQPMFSWGGSGNKNSSRIVGG